MEFSIQTVDIEPSHYGFVNNGEPRYGVFYFDFTSNASMSQSKLRALRNQHEFRFYICSCIEDMIMRATPEAVQNFIDIIGWHSEAFHGRDTPLICLLSGSMRDANGLYQLRFSSHVWCAYHRPLIDRADLINYFNIIRDNARYISV